MNTVVVDEGGRRNENEYDRVEIMSNGWVKGIDEIGDHQTYEHYPPQRVLRVDGEVVYYEQ